MKRVLIACEESQAVCIAFRKRGFEAFSCDILPCSGGHPEWHIQGDAIEAATSQHWDLMIAHPPCTYLSNSGVCWLQNNEQRQIDMKFGAEFFRMLLNLDIPLIAVENPIPHKYAVKIIGRKYDQIIQPYMFGHSESKATCFWLKGLPKLQETNNVKHIWKSLPKNEAQRIHYVSPGPERAKIRSKTFPGIAEAMAEQWGNFLNQSK